MRLLGQPLSGRALAACGLAVGLALALLTLDSGFIRGAGPYWELAQDDPADHLAGLLVFVREPWTWPLLAVRTYGFPEGSNAANLDVIPLAALPVKLLFPLTGRVFNYLGLWVALARVLQALTAVFLLRELGERRPAPVLAAALLCAGLPMLLDRTHVEGLSSQFLILAAFGLYLRTARAGSLPPAAAAASGLLLAALLIHPYLFVMAALVWAAALAERWRRGLLSGPRAAGLLLAQALGLLGVMLACGHLDALRPALPRYGLLPMNLLSPFLSEQSALLPAGRMLSRPGTLAAEGSSYLGLGVLGLLAAALLAARREFLRPLARHPVLLALLAGLTLFALTNRVWLADRLLFTIPLPGPVERLAQLFPTSARFFWPAALALTVWLVAALARRLTAPRAAALLAAACLVQWLDLAPARADSRRRTAGFEEDPIAGLRPALTGLMAVHRTVEVYPSYACGDPQDENQFDIQLQLLAARAGLPINSVYHSRPNKDCGREAEAEARARREAPPEGVLLVLYGRGRPRPPGCREFDRGALCTRQWLGREGAPL